MKRIDISTKKHQNVFTMVDDKDFDFLNQWKWHPHPNGNTMYVERSAWVDQKRRVIQLHRAILGVVGAVLVDHKDGNGLNNTRENLRVCTRAENARNGWKRANGITSIYKGVYWNKRRKRFVARITKNGKQIEVGAFLKEEHAARAYNTAAAEAYGDFSRLNTINDASVPANALAKLQDTHAGLPAPLHLLPVRGSEGRAVPRGDG